MDDSKGPVGNGITTQTTELKPKVNKPLSCDVLILEKCNLHCRKCYFWKHGIDSEVTIAEYKNFIISLKELVEMPFELNLGGGEPLLKPELLELISFSALQGFHPVISTNATLMTKEMAVRLCNSGLQRLSISLESLDSNIHDFITGTAGAHKRLMAAIGYIKKYRQEGLFINIHTVITENNLGGIPDLLEWVNRDSFFSGISFIALAQPFRTEIIDRWYLHSDYGLLWPKDPEKAASIIDMLIDCKNRGYKILNSLAQLTVYKKYYKNPDSFVRVHRCNFGDHVFNVNVLGCVQLCCFMPPIGNIKKSSIKDIWYSEEASKTRALMRNCQKSCNNIVNCYFKDGVDNG